MTTEFNCGIDLQPRQIYICVMDRALLHRNIKNNDFAFFPKLVGPYKDDLAVTRESCFICFWLAGARELTKCLRSSRITPAYVCPRDLRPVCQLLRRRK